MCRVVKVSRSGEAEHGQPRFCIESSVREINDSITAISYAWGAGKLQKVRFGVDPEGNSVNGLLGSEWDVGRLMALLAEICEQHSGYVWMDQLCINQRSDAEVNQALADIPSIFRNSRVKVLFPYGPCPSETSWLLEMLQAIRGGHVTHEQQMAIADHYGTCGSAGLYHHWFTRLWTRQEALYAQRIQMLAVQHPACKPYPSGQDQSALRGSFAESACRLVLSEKLGVRSNSLKAADVSTRFLLGEQLEFDRWSPSFLRQLGSVALSFRSTTDAKDYVLAIWPDLKGYTIPSARRAMSPVALLMDAAVQYENLCGATFPTWVMQGMLDEVASPSFWPASSSLRHLLRLPSKTTFDVFAGCLGAPLLTWSANSHGRALETRIYHGQEGPESVQLRPLEDYFMGADGNGAAIGRCAEHLALCVVGGIRQQADSELPAIHREVLRAAAAVISEIISTSGESNNHHLALAAVFGSASAQGEAVNNLLGQVLQCRERCNPSLMISLLRRCLGIHDEGVQLVVFNFNSYMTSLGVGKPGAWFFGLAGEGRLPVAMEYDKKDKVLRVVGRAAALERPLQYSRDLQSEMLPVC
jgi:hypothetical protein